MERASNRSYSLRGDRMTRAQSQVISQYWDQYAISAVPELYLNQLFEDQKTVILEIGSGMGEATAEIAQADQQVAYLAVEMHRAGLAALLILILEKKLKNIKILREDGVYLLTNFIPDQSIDGIHLLFPDPWPKNRQHKRRIVQAEFVQLIAKKLKPAGFIHIATDWQPYADQIEKIFNADLAFIGGKVERPSWRVISKFERQAIAKGHQVSDFRYLRS